MGAFFITATGTDVGKTFIAAGLIRHLRMTGHEVDAVKPVMSGYDPQDAANSDAGVLLQTLGRATKPEAIEAMSPWRYRAPLSPNMAAARENKQLDVDALITHCRAAIASTQGTLLIEGVGGIMVPLDARRTVLDWMIEVNVPVVLVAGSYLGTISHTLTALNVLQRAKLDVRGVVVNESATSTVTLEDTVATLNRFTNNVIAVPRLSNASDTHPAFAEIAARLT